MVWLLFGDQAIAHRDGSLSRAKKAAAFLRISRSSRRILFSLRRRRSSSRSSVLRPSRSPASTSLCRSQFRSVNVARRGLRDLALRQAAAPQEAHGLSTESGV